MKHPKAEFMINLDTDRYDEYAQNELTEDRLKHIIERALQAHGYGYEWVAVSEIDYDY